MVMGVCRRVLSNPHDAEDAFQATFLVFARKADSVKTHDSLAGWLYRVAYRTSLEARARIARRRSKEQQLDDVPHPGTEPDESRRELLALLDKELDRLPDKYRVPVVLCELEGVSRKEAARTLGLAEGTLSWRLAQAKKLLSKRLARHGLAISGGTLAAAMTPGVASACLRASTVKAVTAGAVPAQVLALTEGVMKVMLLTKLKVAICVGTLALVAGVGVSGLTYRAMAEEPKQLEYYGSVLAKNAESRPATDDFEALRLEIEALRKSLQATRERVKSLEDEVSALKGQRQGPPGAAPGGGRGGRPGNKQGGPPGQERGAGGPGSFPSLPGMPQGMKPPGTQDSMMRKRPSDPVSDAEAALKKLKENPGDKKATEALEKALQRLKEREKSDAPSPRNPHDSFAPSKRNPYDGFRP
jgi:RNA polymerase sigma factor (sigma-70 family)